MNFRSVVEQGITAIQAGNRDEGARLLKIALKDSALQGALRAVACLWLAEVTDHPTEKRQYYNDALNADPNNPDVIQRVEAYLASQFTPPAPANNLPLPTVGNNNRPGQAPVPPASLPGMNTPATSPSFAPAQAALPKTGPLIPVVQPTPSVGLYQVAAVIGGPNGPGSAFFVANEGLLVTTRYVVGGLDQVTVELHNGRQYPGYVVRAYPEYDLALIYVQQQVSELIPVSPMPGIADDTYLTVIGFSGDIARGRKRATKRVLAAHWFPTDIAQLPDAGGGPVLDERNYLVGMITRNTASTSAYVYGLHINVIRNFVEAFRQESMNGAKVYCRHCGFYSTALTSGGYYCERCGGVHSQAENIIRLPQAHMQSYYYEYSRISCPHCNATVGFHRNMCLRCGRSPVG